MDESGAMMRHINEMSYLVDRVQRAGHSKVLRLNEKEATEVRANGDAREVVLELHGDLLTDERLEERKEELGGWKGNIIK